MNSIERAFHVLQLEPTKDRRAIKRAYANLVKQYHPEEYPEKWQEIHEAYKIAEKCATYSPVKNRPVFVESSEEASAVSTPFTERSAFSEESSFSEKTVATPFSGRPSFKEEPPLSRKDAGVLFSEIPLRTEFRNKEKPTQEKRKILSYTPVEREETQEDLFANLNELVQEKKKREEENIAYMRSMALLEMRKMKSVHSLRKWEQFFETYTEEYLCTEDTLNEWGNIMSHLFYRQEFFDLFLEKARLVNVVRTNGGGTIPKGNRIDPYAFVKSLINQKRKRRVNFLLGIAGVVLCLGLGFSYIKYREPDPTKEAMKIAEQAKEDKIHEQLQLYVEQSNQRIADQMATSGMDLMWQASYFSELSKKTKEEFITELEDEICLAEGMHYRQYPYAVYKNGITLKQIEDTSVIDLPEIQDNILYAGELISSQYLFSGFLCVDTQKTGLDDYNKIYIIQDGQLIELLEFSKETDVNSDTILYYRRANYTLFWLKISPSENGTGVTFLFTK